jgi:hypothetical protein
MIRHPMTSLSPPLQSLLELFKGPLGNVRFADIDAEGLANLAAEVEAAASEVQRQEGQVAQLREALIDRQEALLQLAQRALAYARVYAENDEALLEEVNRIALPRAPKPRKPGAAKAVAREARPEASDALPGVEAEAKTETFEAQAQDAAGEGRDPAPHRTGRKGRGPAAQRAAT